MSSPSRHCEWLGGDITPIKVISDHYSGIHAGYGFIDAAAPKAVQRVTSTCYGMPIPYTNRSWRLHMCGNAAVSTSVPMGTEANVYVGKLEASHTDYQFLTAFCGRYGSECHDKVILHEHGQLRSKDLFVLRIHKRQIVPFKK